MGYFANGTEGDLYTERFCEQCVHWSEAFTCPCWLAHFLWAYEECNRLDSLLHKMIPRQGIKNLQCFAFVARPEESP